MEDLVFRVVLRGARPPVPIDLIDIRPGVLLENDDFEVVAFPVVHRGPGCFGYLFREKPRRPFLPEKAEALGVPAGPIRRDLVNGKDVTLADGRVIHPDEVLGPDRPGVSLALVGDIGQTDGLSEIISGVDVLVCEATYLERDSEMARHFGHLTAAQAARLARDAGAQRLVLNHLSQRYRVREILEETRPIFADAVVARDFDRFTVTREKITLTNEELQEDDVLLKAPETTVD
ncbi:MAG: ribonuclease Z [Anaerolineae bacterium]